MDIIERAARALCEQHIRKVRGHDTDPTHLEEMIVSAVNYAWRDFIPQARAVLSALREPDEGMIEAGTDYRPVNPQVRAKDCWQAMIDQALKG